MCEEKYVQQLDTLQFIRPICPNLPKRLEYVGKKPYRASVVYDNYGPIHLEFLFKFERHVSSRYHALDSI